ncbi:hypothetical protein [Viridibacillus arvi]|uniref:hypothetical protein n=1 Tax=Viridibacillus arvi TaxID=263475 RepID=UPI00187B5565|nr:hypothetical protein [Viridibacillus sp. JNUCC-6]QOV10924.1 hypothetical protein JNUCC6_20540 [Viridibacillus sp. JNUCC-6]
MKKALVFMLSFFIFITSLSLTTLENASAASKPKLYTWSFDAVDPNTNLVLIMIKNKSDKDIVIQPQAYLFDADYEEYDRDLQLIKVSSKNKVSTLKKQIIKKNKSADVWFKVKGNKTWYDGDSRIYFYYKYNNKKYKKIISSHDNDYKALDDDY